MDYLSYSETPVVEISHPLLERRGIQLLVKREDLNHELVSGNKWWKLKYNIIEARRQKKNTLLTFGGAYSNHIYATAATAALLGFASIGIIRGERTLPVNPTLEFAIRQDMKLHYLSREVYRRKGEAEVIESLQREFGDFYLIPEGGTNALAVKGTAEFGRELLRTQFNYALLAVGTGGTMAGLINGFEGQRHIIGLPVLKGGAYLVDEIKGLTQESHGQDYNNWNLWTEYHHGGYAKTTPQLLSFMREMQHAFQIPLDHVYTGKLLYAIFHEIENGAFPRGTSLLAIHTGGLQGARPI